MVLMTMIARASDGLPLAASLQEDEQVNSGRNLLEYQNQAKMLFKKLTVNSPNRCSIETGPYLFHYVIDNEVCYLVLCERGFSKKSAFTFLEEMSAEFNSQYGRRVAHVSRPYSFIEFDTYIQKLRRQYSDQRGRRHMHQLREDLNDVQRIMMDNIDDVLQRGAALSDLETKASGLSMMSKKYHKDAQYLNMRSTYAKIAAGAVVGLVFLVYFFVF
ncbi:vesicle-trafficking protein SEC22b-B-like isoform X1 [Penaeus monodon]|uniref:vesicle-trafficking protein SEC22b-B-like isoform X1 n=1 Tax=Penaeus monodon TaxID=6687 RepID=UPI0018A7D48C|nr:vesicle-trafficking protein SEC22b-B-like isoform X1 [Penaeus monodon]